MTLCSKKIYGDSLHEFIESVNRGEASYDDLDLFSYSVLVIGGLLTSPHDLHADNFIVEYGTCAHSDGSGRVRGKRRLVAIDNDSTLVGDRVEIVGGRAKFLHKNALYLLPLMNHPIDNRIFQALKSLPDGFNLVTSWLKHLCEHSVEYDFLLGDETFRSIVTDAECVSPEDRKKFESPVLPKAQVQLMKSKYDELIRFLREKGELAPTHSELFRHLIPDLSGVYGTLAQEFQRAPQDINIFYRERLQGNGATGDLAREHSDLTDVHALLNELVPRTGSAPPTPAHPLASYNIVKMFPAFPMDDKSEYVHGVKPKLPSWSYHPSVLTKI